MLSLFVPASVAAQVVGIQTPDSVRNVSSLAELIPRLFNIAVGVAGILFVVLLLLGGVQYLVSLGDEDAVTKARKLMLNAGIGLVIVLSSWAVGNYVLRLLGISVSLTGGTVQSSQTPVGGGAAPTSGGGSPTTPTTPGTTAPASGSQSSELQAAQSEVIAAQEVYNQKLDKFNREVANNPNANTSNSAEISKAQLELNVAAQDLRTAKDNLAKIENRFVPNGG